LLSRRQGNASEIWISARTNALGTSTMLETDHHHPFTAILTFIINLIPPNTTEHLLAGVFYTKGNQADGDPIPGVKARNWSGRA